MNGDALPVAVRAWTERQDESSATGAPSPHSRGAHANWPRSDYVLVFDTETTTDAAQALNFGAYCVCRWEPDGTLSPVQEGLFFADDLRTRDADGYQALQDYAAAHGFHHSNPRKRLFSRREFVRQVFYPWAYSTRALVVGFNLPFDLSRLAVEWGAARNGMRGGFSLRLADYIDAEGATREHQFRPRVRVQHLDSKKALIRFARAWQPDRENLIPHDSLDGLPDPAYTFRGHFLDLRTFAWALTNRGHSLDSAAKALATEHRKAQVEGHGHISAEYLDYARNDVLVTTELLEKLRGEFDRHPVQLEATKAYSPASVGKAYLRALGIEPILRRQPDFQRDVLGYAMSAFYGGRAECRIRHTSVPVTVTDFTSMYPTVNALMDNWALLTAEHVKVEDATTWARGFLARVTLDVMFGPAAWGELAVLVEVEPDGDILPVRAQYAASAGSTYEIGVNPFTATDPYWYTLADCIAATLLGGRPPRLRRALRFRGVGRQPGLRTVALRGAVAVDPKTQDFFRAVIEERQRAKRREDLAQSERERLDQFLKVLANSATYGVFAEMNRDDRRADQAVTVAVWGADGAAFTVETATPEQPGDFCFPPLAALITGAARLMLALLERCVTDAGGTYAFCDTDSLAIVSSPAGELLPCAGGPLCTADGRPAIRALAWAEVDRIVVRFAALNPYDASAVPGSVLKVEDVNFDRQTGERHTLHCLAISAKRYCLYNLAPDGEPRLRKVSEHGLGGVYLDPTDPRPRPDPRSTDPLASAEVADDAPTVVDASKGRPWIVEAWRWLLGHALGRPVAEPPWLDRPAVSRLTVTSPALLRPFDGYNRGRPASGRVRPFNFVLLAHPADPLASAPPSPMAPFETDARQWERMAWTDRHTGRSLRVRVCAADEAGVVEAVPQVLVATFRTVLEQYRFHPEAKSLAADGRPNAKQAVGLLRRRPVEALTRAYIGKEANKLEEVALGLVRDESEVLNRYLPSQHTTWDTIVWPVLADVPRGALQAASTAWRK